MTCLHCRWWSRFQDESWAQCRRNPPTAFQQGALHSGYKWPVTVFDDWCGSFEAKEPT